MELILRNFQFTIKIIYIFVNFFLCRFKRKKKLPIPPIKDRILLQSVTELMDLVRQRQITSQQIVLAYIKRIREVNPHINAVVSDRFAAALQDAAAADEKINNCPKEKHKNLFMRYPILGIPFTVKESCGVKGMPHIVGSLQRVGKIAEVDCEPVKKLREAGGIPLLITANPEYCYGIETTTYTHGRCLNPYDAQRTCGGSSGGEAALQACGASLFGVGSDICGGIRIPALFNGIFGHKPTGGLIANQGHFPNSPDPKCLEYLQMGPMTRFASDLPLLLHIIGGKHAKRLILFKPINESCIKIFYSFGFTGLNGFLHQAVVPDIKRAILRAISHFKYKEIPVKMVKIEHFHNSTEIALANYVRLRNYPYVMTDNNQAPTIRENIDELIRSSCGSSRYTREALVFEILRSTSCFMPADSMRKYEPQAERLKNEILRLLGNNGVLLFPTFHVPAIHHGSSVLPQWCIDYCLIFNILGLPCTHIPMGFDQNGLPIGFQVIANTMRDKLCLHVAQELEKAFGGWVPPT